MTAPDAAPARWLASIALGAAFLALWLIQHGYAGLSHDSQLYTLLATAHLEPSLLGSDIMLRFSSQDSFTLFSPIYASAINLLGTEPAAALLTFLSQLAFIAGAAFLARRLMPAPSAWLGLALVCALPGFYGARNVFAVVESFATPRLLAEALILAGLGAFLARRLWIASGLALAAAALHPLMAAAGVAVALFMNPAPARARMWTLAGASIIAGIAFAVLAARGEQFQFDDDWLRLLRSGTDYLFPMLWPIASWAREAVVLNTLLVGALALEKSPARSLCIAAGLAAVAGTAISYVGGDLLRIVLIVQLQLWRWNWIATFAATSLLPFIVMRAWSQGTLWRAVAFLLGAAWLFMTQAFAALAITALLIPLAALARRKSIIPAGSARALFLGAGTVAGLAVLFHVALVILAAAAGADESSTPAAIKAARAFGRTGWLPWLAFLAAFAVVQRATMLPGKVFASGCCLILLAALLPTTAREWSATIYGPEPFRAFESWRERIPAGTEVLWFDSPLSSWLLLRRPSYLSNQQEASALFSRSAAMAMKARVDAVAPNLEPTTFVGWAERRPVAPSPDGAAPGFNLAGLCASTDVKYVITHGETAATPIAATAPNAPSPFRDIQLHACP
ncbi:MAG: hypothetical protein WDO68_22435 [Gammaproteobacteria bacterium]